MSGSQTNKWHSHCNGKSYPGETRAHWPNDVPMCHTDTDPQEGVERPMANTDTDSRKMLVKGLEDVYALESHLVQVLNDHAKDAQDEPVIRQKIEQHLRETELHRDRIEQRLNALGAGKPGFKTTVSNVMGQVLGGTGGSRTNPLAKNARDEYASEQLEIASYVELITLAQSLGDVETVRTAQLNLRDEMAMQQWLIEHMPEVTLRGLQREAFRCPQMPCRPSRTCLPIWGWAALAHSSNRRLARPSRRPFKGQRSKIPLRRSPKFGKRKRFRARRVEGENPSSMCLAFPGSWAVAGVSTYRTARGWSQYRLTVRCSRDTRN